MNGRELLEARLLELDRLAYERNILKCTGFLSYDEQSEYHRLSKSRQFLSLAKSNLSDSCSQIATMTPTSSVPAKLMLTLLPSRG